MSYFVRGGFDCEGGDEYMVLQCQWWRLWKLAEEDELRELEAAEKAREMGGSRMIIDEILCLFLLPKFCL